MQELSQVPAGGVEDFSAEDGVEPGRGVTGGGGWGATVPGPVAKRHMHFEKPSLGGSSASRTM